MTIDTVRRALHDLVETLDETRAREALSFMEWLAEPDRPSAGFLALVDAGEAEIAAGDFVTLGELR